jgi:hypothetical protein
MTIFLHVGILEFHSLKQEPSVSLKCLCSKVHILGAGGKALMKKLKRQNKPLVGTSDVSLRQGMKNEVLPVRFLIH